jgi:hypothetical protein
VTTGSRNFRPTAWLRLPQWRTCGERAGEGAKHSVIPQQGRSAKLPDEVTLILYVDSHLESTLYYTMSTVAQTLAGAIGLLGAIVLFTLQATGRSVERASKRLAEIPHESTSELYIRHLLSRRSYRELARRYGEMLRPSSEMSTDLLVYHSTLVWELEHEDAIRRSFWNALVASAVIIAYAIACLALATQLAEREGSGDIALLIAVFGAIGCLILFGSLLRVVLRTAPSEPGDGPLPEYPQFSTKVRRLFARTAGSR